MWVYQKYLKHKNLHSCTRNNHREEEGVEEGEEDKEEEEG